GPARARGPAPADRAAGAHARPGARDLPAAGRGLGGKREPEGRSAAGQRADSERPALREGARELVLLRLADVARVLPVDGASGPRHLLEERAGGERLARRVDRS